MRTALLFILLILLSSSVNSQTVEFTPINLLGESLVDPYDLLVGSNGDIFIADNYQTRVFDANGNFKKEFGYHGVMLNEYTNSQQKSSIRLAMDQEGYLYILGRHGTVRKIDSAGNTHLYFSVVQNPNPATEYTKGIAVDKLGHIYIADTYNNRILKHDKEGKLLQIIGSKGTGQAQFNQPTQLQIDATGNLLIADSNNGRVQVLSSTGNYIKEVGKTENNGAPMYPVDVTVDSNNHIFIADTISYQIREFDTTGKILRTFGAKGPDKGKFQLPNLTVAINSDASVLVLEGALSFKTRVQKFNTEGNYTATLVDNSNSRNFILMASDPAGNFVATDNVFGVIRKYDKDGNLLLSFDSKASGQGKSDYHLRDVATDRQGNIYTLEQNKSGGVKKFTPYGQLINQYAPTSNSTLELGTVPVDPLRIAFDSKGNTYLADWSYFASGFFKYDLQGRLIKKFKLFNPETNDTIKFNLNTSFDISNDDELYVLNDSGILKYTIDGEYIGKFIPSDYATYGATPRDIDFDQQGDIYISEVGYIKRYNKDGQLLSQSTYHSTLINKGLYSKISVNKNGSLIIADAYGRLSVFASNQKSASYEAGKNYISGQIFNDVSDNCILESGEASLAGIVVEAMPGPYYGVSDKSGKYFIEVDT